MKILMVCLGNICRSPLARGVLQHLAEKETLAWEVDSAGTGDWHVGQSPDRRSVAVAKNNGIDISAQRAQHFTPALFDRYDKIVAMDRQNLTDILAQARHEDDRQKVSLFLQEDDVPDPYYDGNLFISVFQTIEARSRELLAQWREEQKDLER